MVTVVGDNFILCWNFSNPLMSILYRNVRFVLKTKTPDVFLLTAFVIDVISSPALFLFWQKYGRNVPSRKILMWINGAAVNTARDPTVV